MYARSNAPKIVQEEKQNGKINGGYKIVVRVRNKFFFFFKIDFELIVAVNGAALQTKHLLVEFNRHLMEHS